MKRRTGGNARVTWLSVKAGQAPPTGRTGRAQRLPHTTADERAVMHEDRKGKPGAVGTSGNRGSLDSSSV